MLKLEVPFSLKLQHSALSQTEMAAMVALAHLYWQEFQPSLSIIFHPWLELCKSGTDKWDVPQDHE